METNNKEQSMANYPHIGRVLFDYFAKLYLNRAKLARQLNIADSSIQRILDRDSMQLKKLWKISVALNYNFIAELGEKLPVDYITTREKELENQVAELQKEMEKINIELSVYKNIVGK